MAEPTRSAGHSSPAILLLAAGILCLPGLLVAQETPSFPSETSVITVDVVAVDKKGEPVTDLKQSDFTVTDDGIPQTITAFEMRDLERGTVGAAPAVQPERVATNEGAASSQGRLLAFVVDDQGLSPVQGLSAVKTALTGWLEKGSDPRDEVTLVTTSGDVWWSTQVAQGKDDLLAIVDRITAKRAVPIPAERMTDWEAAQIAVYSSPAGCAGVPGNAFCRVVKRWIESGACGIAALPGQPGGSAKVVGDKDCEHVVRKQAETIYGRTQRRQQATLGTVERLSEGWAQRRGRKAIFVFSEGFIEIPQRDPAKAAVSASQKGNTAVYYVDVRGLLTDSLYSAEQRAVPAAADVTAMTLDDFAFAVAGGESLADATGGSAVVNTNDVLPGLTRATEESGRYYLLGYPSPHPHDGRWHDLKVEVRRPGVKVRARKGYLASPEGAPLVATESKADRDSVHLLDPALMVGTLDDRIPLRLAARAIAGGADGMRVLVGLDLDTAALAFTAQDGPQPQATFDVTLLAVSRDHPRVSPVEQRVSLHSLDGTARSWWATAQEVTLPAGPAQIKVLVRDVASGNVGTVAQRLDVPSEIEAAPDEISQSVGMFQFGTHDGRRDAQAMEKAISRLVDTNPECHLVLRGRIENRAGKTIEEWIHQWPPASLGAAPPSLESRHAVSLTQGEYLLESDLIDVATGAVSVAYEPFAVPAPSDLALSSLVLVGGGAPLESSAGAPDDPFVVGAVRFRPLLSRRIVPGTPQLPLLARIYSKTTTPAELTLTIMRDEKALATLPVSPPAPDAAGRVAWLGTLPVASLPAGDYELVLHAARGDEKAEARTSFEIAAPAASAPTPVPAEAPAERTAAPAVKDPKLAAVLAKAGQYIVDYAKAFRDVVAEEVYLQRYTPDRYRAQSRITHADVVFATLGGPFLWGTFRDVRTVDGHEVHEDVGRLEKLFERGDRAALQEARAIRAESARYNIGVARTINEPTLPLMFLHPQNQGRFKFRLKGHHRVEKREAVEVAYRETHRPTMISDSHGGALPAEGSFWIDPTDGTVLRSEIELASQTHFTPSGTPVESSAHITVEYREEPGLSVFVPDKMTEYYGSTYARATYSHYRRFTVTTQEAIGLAPKK